MIQVYILAGAVLAASVAAGGAAWKVQDWRYASIEKERLEAEGEKRRMDAKQIDTAAAGHEADKREIQTKFITITETVERIVREPFYAPGAPACLDADGLRQLSEATGAADPASEPAGAVPKPSSTD